MAATTTRRLKVTYSLPGELLRQLERSAKREPRAKSAIVADALRQYFARGEKRELEAAFEEAAGDRLFLKDNAAILSDFAKLDAEVARRRR